MKILVFLHGTVIMHRAGLGKTPSERVQQVKRKDPSVYQYENYVSVGESSKKISEWVEQGAEVIYLSPHKSSMDVEKDRRVLDAYLFPQAPIVYREDGKSYAQVAEEIKPDVLIEDDCESIGGKDEMVYPFIRSRIRQKIKHISIKEFEGIDHLPGSVEELIAYDVCECGFN